METRIKVIGVGGAGCNALNLLAQKSLPVELIGVSTDLKSLANLECEKKIQLGDQITRGLGTAGDIDIGKKIAQESTRELKTSVENGDLVFIITGMGGGLGTAVAPKIIQYAAEAGAMVICFAIMPFSFEGKKRLEQSHEGLKRLQINSGKVIPLYNDVLLQQLGDKKTALEAFNLANAWISDAISSICSIITQNGIINLDFATIRETFSGKISKILFGLGKGEGEDYLNQALDSFVKCPLLELPGDKLVVDKLLVSIIGGNDFTLDEANQVIDKIKKKLKTKDDIIIGVVLDEQLEKSLDICVIGSVVSGRKQISGMPAVDPKQTKESIDLSVEANRYQGEFAFGSDDDQRGYFSATEKSLYNGEDLDIPTYMRRGIKISL